MSPLIVCSVQNSETKITQIEIDSMGYIYAYLCINIHVCVNNNKEKEAINLIMEGYGKGLREGAGRK